MKAIFKYGVDNDTLIRMPEGANITSAGQQNGAMVVWAQVDTENPEVLRKVKFVGTGWEGESGEGGRFVGTVQMPNGLVFHVFDYGEVKRG